MADTSLVFNIIARDSGVGRALSAVQRAFRGAGQSAQESLGEAANSTQNLDRMLGEAHTRVQTLSEEFERTGDKKLFGQISRDRSLISNLEKIRTTLRSTKDDGDHLGDGANNLGGTFARLSGVFSSVGGSLGGLGGQLSGAIPPMGQMAFMAVAISGAMFAAVPAIYAVGGAAAALPGMLSGAIAALFTLKLGLSGLSENWKAMNTPAAGGGGGGGGAKDDPTPRIRAVEAAQRQVTRSTRDIADAQVDLKEATDAVNKARVEEKERIEDLRRSLASARADEEDSVQSLAEARMQLALAEQRGNPDEIRRAQIAVDKQAASLEEAKDKTEDLQKENDEAAQKGVEGSDAVVTAKKREKDAQRAVQDAVEQHKLALQQLADAQKALNQQIAGAGAAAGGVGVVLPKIAKSAQEFLNELKRLKPAFDDLRLAVQQALFEGLAGKLRVLAQNWLPALKTGLVDMADTINGIVKTAMDSLSKPEFIKNIMDSVDAFRSSLGEVGEAIAGPLVDAFGRLAGAARPFILMLGDKLAGIVTQFSNWIKKADESGKLQQFMEKATHIVGKLFDIFTDLARITGDVISILFGTNAGSTDAWDNLASAVHKVADFMGNPANQKKISDFLDRFGGAVFMVGTLLAKLDDLYRTGQKVVQWIKDAYQNVKDFFTGLPQVIGKFFSDLGTWFAALPGMIWGWLKQIPDLIWDIFTRAMSGAAYLVGWGIRQTGNLLVALPGLIWSWIKNIPGLFKSAVSNAMTFLRNFGPQAWNAVRNVGSLVWSALSNLPSLMYNAGRNAVLGLWNGITGLWNWLWSKVYNLGSSMWNAFMQGIGARSPSRKFALAGRYAVLGAAMGLDDNAGILMDSADRLAQQLAGVPMNLAGVNGDLLEGQLEAAAHGTIAVQANRKQQVTVKFDVTGGDGALKKWFQKGVRTQNLLQTN